MLTPALVLWWLCILLEFLILFRALRTPIFRNYPFFCIYLTCVLASDLSLFWLYRYSSPTVYQHFYWTKEFVCVIAGYAVVLEIIRAGLAPHKGAQRIARNAALLVFAVIVGFTAAQSIMQRNSHLVLTTIEVERNLRTAELFLLTLVIILLSYYRIFIGLNLKGILLGYGFGVAAIVISSAVRSYAGTMFTIAFSYMRSYSYTVVLLVWVFSLWSYCPNPVSEVPAPVTQNYEGLVQSTRQAIDAVRGHLGKAGRS